MACARPLHLVACMTLAAGLSGCGSHDGMGELFPFVPIDSKILITMSERLDHSGRSMILNCRTARTYGCSNYRLAYTRERLGSVTSIAFLYVRIPEVCLTSLGPARADIDLGSLAPGKYLFEISSGGKSVGAALSVSPDSCVVANGESPTIDFPVPHLNRVPDNTVWGLIGYLGHQGEPFDSLAGAFLDSLTARGASVGSFAPGDYGYFVIDASGAIERPSTDGYYFALPFIRRFAGDPALVRDLVAYFGRTQGFFLSIQVHTWRGDAYYGWVLAGNP